ncbi:hypothetical protein FPV67DRAFT_1622026 [Lyophyllum atratum]|nr:hypothetical protein FPV67DRAFT_1622026 [Lyophyllum atratum]
MSQHAHSSTFRSIGEVVYLSPSPSSQGTTPSMDEGVDPPTLVLIFGWMGAKLSHLHKYTKVYEEMYPNATKVLIRCPHSFFWSRESSRRARLAPVVETLQALGYLPPSNRTKVDTSQMKLIQPRLLIHAFSNGGCSQLLCLSRLLASQFPNFHITHPSTSAIILDSCPGIGTLQQAKRAMGTLVRHPLLKSLLNAVITWLYFYSAITRLVFGTKNMPELLKIRLNAPRLLPWVRKSTPRLYLYSKKDEMVPFQDVEGHAKDAEAAGLNVRAVVFEDTPHVSHARIEPERYWTAVKAVWKDACGDDAAGGIRGSLN